MQLLLLLLLHRLGRRARTYLATRLLGAYGRRAFTVFRFSWTAVEIPAGLGFVFPRRQRMTADAKTELCTFCRERVESPGNRDNADR